MESSALVSYLDGSKNFDAKRQNVFSTLIFQMKLCRLYWNVSGVSYYFCCQTSVAISSTSKTASIFPHDLMLAICRSVRYLQLRQNSLLNKISICKLLICSGNDLYKDVSERANNVFSLPINNYHKFVVNSRFNFGRTHVALKRVVCKLV